MIQAHQPAASSRRIVIMGCGVVAAAIAIALSDQGHIVSILDRHRESFDRLRSGKTRAGEIVPVVGDGTLQQSLLKASIQDAEVFIALSESDTRNALAAQVANRIFQVPVVVSRIDDLAIQAMYNDQGIVAIGVAALMTELAVNAANK
jgi:trk system potassium uptake protein TrkA